MLGTLVINNTQYIKSPTALLQHSHNSTMKFVFLLIVSVVFAASIDQEKVRGLTDNLALTEDEFLDEFHLPPVDDPVERARRAEALEQHQHEVQEVNEAFMAGNKTWYDAINEFSDIPDDEFLRTHTGLTDDHHPEDERSERFFDAYRYRRTNVPDSYNSVSLGNVSPVKSQGACGSCVAFATIGIVETCFKRTVGKFGDYSEQHLLGQASFSLSQQMAQPDFVTRTLESDKKKRKKIHPITF